MAERSKNTGRRATRRTARSPKATARFDRSHLKEFRDMLLARRAQLLSAYHRYANEAAAGPESEGSSMPIHPADIGSDAFERDLTLGLLESEREELNHIQAALERIERGTYGECESCKQPIPLARLRALPYARMCVECKSKEEANP